MRLTIGRIVHFFDEDLRDYGPNHTGPYAAIVTFVHNEMTIDLTVFPSHVFTSRSQASVERDAGDRGVRMWWAWPPREINPIPQQTLPQDGVVLGDGLAVIRT